MKKVNLFLVIGIVLLPWSWSHAEEKKVKIYHRTFQKVDLSPGQVPKILAKPLAYTQYVKKPTTLKDILALSDKKILSLITAKATFIYSRCPKCASHAAQGVELYYNSDWHISDPFHIRCHECGVLLPSKEFPETEKLKVKTPTGKTQIYHYHKRGEDMFMMTDTARHRVNEVMMSAAPRLARLWLITRQRRYARRAILIMDRFSQVWYDIPVHSHAGNNIFQFRFFSAPPYLESQCTKIGRYRGHVVPFELVKAYDLLYDCDEFEKMSREKGYDVRGKIVRCFKDSAHMLIREMSPVPDEVMRVAYCLNDPQMMHWAVRRLFNSFCAEMPYCLDGQDPRGSGYHRARGQHLDQVNKFVKGYSDPPGYVDLEDGARFDNLDIIKLNPRMWGYLRKKTAEAKPKFRFPNGYVAAVHNAWSTRKNEGPALTRSRPWLFPGFGHAILGRGKGKNQIQAHLHFSCTWGHAEADMLNIIIFAKGHEFVPDFGYCHDILRAWSSSSLSHNTVLIDEKEQDFRKGNHNFGNLLFYDVTRPEVLIADAEGKRAYDSPIHHVVPDIEEYRRSLVVVPVSDQDAYVVDIFRVKGGKLHDWVIHTGRGPKGDESQEIEVGLDMRPRKGTLKGPGAKFEDVKMHTDEVWEDRDSEYGLVDNIVSAKTGETWTATMRFKDDPEAAMKLTMLGGAKREIVLADAPNSRATNQDSKVWKTAKTRILMVREKARQSVFIAAWEPYRGKPFIKQVSRLKVKAPRGDRTVGIKVELKNGRVDYILASDGEAAVEAAGIEFQGRFGLVSEEARKVKFMYLGGGTRIAKAGKEVRGRDVTGKVTGVKTYVNNDGEKCLMIALDEPKDAALCSTKNLKGRVIRITHYDGSTHFYEIERVEKSGNGFVVYTDEDPGFMMTYRNVTVNEPTLPLLVTKFLYFPLRTVEGGTNRFTIFGSEAFKE